MAGASGFTEVAKATVTIIPNMQGAQGAISSELAAAYGAAAPASEKAGGKAGGMFAGGMGAALKKLLPVVTFAALAEAAIKSYVAIEEGANNVIKATGAQGEAAESLIDTYKNVASAVVGDYGEIGSVVGELNTRLDLQGEELEYASEQVLKYAKVTGQDATTAAKEVASMLRATQIPAEDLSIVLDKLTKSGQAAGIDVSKLATNVQKYAGVLKTAGFTTEETIALLAQFEKSGADTATVLQGMKKGIAKWESEGKNAKEEFLNFVTGVQDGSVTAADAIDIFGTRAGLSMYDAAKKGQLNFEEMYDAIENDSAGALDAVYSETLTAGEKFDLLGQKAAIAFQPIGDVLYNILMPVLDWLIEWLPYFIESISMTFEAFQNTFDQIGANVETVKQNVFDTVTNIVSFIANVPGQIVGFFTGIAAQIGAFFNNAKTNILNAFNSAVNFVRSIPGKIVGFFSGIGGRLISPFSAAVNGIRNVFNNVLNFIRSIPGKITGFFSNMKISLPHIKLPHFKLSGTFDPLNGKIPGVSIEWYARGGIATGVSLYGIGEAGNEAIVPLSNPYMAPFAQAVAEEMPERNDAAVLVNWLNMNLGNIIEEYAPTATPREFGRMVRSVI